MISYSSIPAVLVLLGAGAIAHAQLLSAPPPGARVPKPPLYNTTHLPPATHRFWAAKNWFPTNLTNTGAPFTMFAEPLAMQTTPRGLLVSASSLMTVTPDFFVHPLQPDITLGTKDLHSDAVNVSRSSDWLVDFDFGPITTRVGRGMPFVYGFTNGANPVITFVADPHLFKRSDTVVAVTLGNNSYALFCPSGGQWQIDGRVFTCLLPKGSHYFSLALLPDPEALALFSKYAFSFPESTAATWHYDEPTGRVSTTYTVETRAMEGREAGFVQALYPHQYTSLAGDAITNHFAYTSARGPMKLYTGPVFHTVDLFHGILPFLPVSRLPADQHTLAALVARSGADSKLLTATETYGLGKELGRAAQLLPLAQAVGASATLARLRAALETRIAEWFSPSPTPNTPGFFYNTDWSTVIGYPASYGSDEQLNDHHFHYGYWIHTAALLGLYDPAWLERNDGGKAINLLARDIATSDRSSTSFPFLRHFDIYAGHSWASGQAPFGDGENEESSSEAVNAWAGLILYATEVDDLRLRDAAVWMYTLETNAAFDYWFNRGPVATFPAGFERTQIANLFDGKADSSTWFGNDAAFEHGIEFLPFTGASLYLGRDSEYSRLNLAEASQKTGGHIDLHSKLWPDLLEMYEAFYDPRAARRQWEKTVFTFDGESRAHEFAWLSSLVALGRVNTTITADTPFYAVFNRGTASLRHVAFNLGRQPRRVTFSDGFAVTIPRMSYAVDTLITKIR